VNKLHYQNLSDLAYDLKLKLKDSALDRNQALKSYPLGKELVRENFYLIMIILVSN